MPIYEYLCQDCGHKFETMQRISAAPQTTCPSCGKEALKKLISPVGFQLKGTGWYVTDFRDKDKGKDKGKDKDKDKDKAKTDKTDKDGGGGGGGETKSEPAAKESSADSSKSGASNAGAAAD